jgi:hypothetical protein
MKKLLSFAAILLLLAGSFACGNEKEKEPTEIPFTDFYISHCWWSVNPESPYGQIQENVYILNADDILSNYFSCFYIATEEPRIDFEKYSLIAVWGQKTENGYIETPTTSYVKQTGASSYEWCIDVTLSNQPRQDYEYWFRSALIPKIPSDSKFELIVNYHYNLIF